MLDNIPDELRSIDQWVSVDKKGKHLNPKDGTAASSTDPETWGSFDEAIELGNDHVAFVLTQDDPYCVIDLDDKLDKPATPEQLERHAKIIDLFNSYTEISSGGRGYHVIIKGAVPSGAKRETVEIYSAAKFMTLTGNVVNAVPINSNEGLLATLWHETKKVKGQYLTLIDLEEVAGLATDSEVINTALSASNGEKFDSLCKGDMSGYSTQSEADLALLSILAFYTYSNDQVRRLFRMSALGKREKATKNDKYLDFTLRRIRSQQAPMLNFDNLILPKKEKVEATPTPEPIDDLYPPGLVGELAEYFYSTSIRPVREISLAASIACLAGICGRAYNISNQGLSQYLILLAKTGTGKEAMSGGISKLFNLLRPRVPMVTNFLGPSSFSSGPAVHRTLAAKPCFLSILGEFGYTVQRLSSNRAISAELTLKQLILDVYGKSGFGQLLLPSAYSNIEKDIAPVASPNITILGEATPESFYEGLDASHIESGFLSRFLIMEYKGDRPNTNKNFNKKPSDELIEKMVELVTVSLTVQNNNTFCPVEISKQGQTMLDTFDAYADSKIRGAQDLTRQIWNRAHLKALKLSGLLAVGCDPHNPVVTEEIATWVIQIVEQDCVAIQERFSSGDVGLGDSKQIHDIERIVENWQKMSTHDSSKYGATEKMLKAGIIPYNFLLRKTYSLAAFRNDRLGSTMALKRALSVMVDTGLLIEVPKIQLSSKFSFSGTAYAMCRT